MKSRKETISRRRTRRRPKRDAAPGLTEGQAPVDHTAPGQTTVDRAAADNDSAHKAVTEKSRSSKAVSKPAPDAEGTSAKPEPSTQTVVRRSSRKPKARRTKKPPKARQLEPETSGNTPRKDGSGEQPPLILERSQHPISRKDISSGTLKVLYRLGKLNYRGFLCGGAVRDLMLERQPKDFDVCTDAKPHQIKRAFRNARIIGRRFRLAHIIFHDELVEVATFRRTPDPDEQATGPDNLLITNDNAFGTPLEDAFRRDFTINGLFYDIGDYSVIDYVGGIKDLELRLIRVIGDPDLRFCEDPVRMLRACEFAGRLGFSIEVGTQRGIQENRHELLKASPARLVEELVQLLRCGHAGAACQWMLDLGVLEVLLPEVLAMIEAHERGAGSFTGLLTVLDQMAADGEELPDEVLLAAILLPSIMLKRFDYESRQGRFMSAAQFRRVVEATLDPFGERFSVAKHKRAMMIHALDGFHKLCSQEWTPAQRARFASKSYFDDALRLFEILVHATGEGQEMLEHWLTARRQRRRHPEPHVETKRRPRKRRRGRRR